MLVTVAQIKTLLDVDVEEIHLVQAQADIENIGGIDLDDAEALASLRPLDLKRLKWALTYQAAWLSTQIDNHARLDVLEISGATSDGAIKARDELTLVLAPRCRSNLERVAWKTKATKVLPSVGRARTAGPIVTAAEVTVRTDPMDTPDQLANALRDAGPYWGELPDRRVR